MNPHTPIRYVFLQGHRSYWRRIRNRANKRPCCWCGAKRPPAEEAIPYSLRDYVEGVYTAALLVNAGNLWYSALRLHSRFNKPGNKRNFIIRDYHSGTLVVAPHHTTEVVSRSILRTEEATCSIMEWKNAATWCCYSVDVPWSIERICKQVFTKEPRRMRGRSVSEGIESSVSQGSC